MIQQHPYVVIGAINFLYGAVLASNLKTIALSSQKTKQKNAFITSLAASLIYVAAVAYFFGSGAPRLEKIWSVRSQVLGLIAGGLSGVFLTAITKQKHSLPSE